MIADGSAEPPEAAAPANRDDNRDDSHDRAGPRAVDALTHAQWIVAVLGTTLTPALVLFSANTAPVGGRAEIGWAVWMCVEMALAFLWLRDDVERGGWALAGRMRVVLAAVHGVVSGLPLQGVAADAQMLPALFLLPVLWALGMVAAARAHPRAARWFARLLLASAAVGLAQATSAALALPAIALAGLVCELLGQVVQLQTRALGRLEELHAQGRGALAAASAELQEAKSSRIRILGTVSHEIRQPVHALGMMVERLRIDPGAAEFRGQVDEISSVVRSLAHSLAMLLDISRLDAGTVNVKIGTESVDALMERLKREFAVDAKRKFLTLDCSNDLHAKIETDIALFYSAVANCVSNAIRYTDRGRVKVFASRRNAQELWIHVVDTGRGIPDDKLNDIFHEYVRLDREQQSAQGFGLGLAIVKRTANLLGLTVEVESKLGIGSEFRISVPASRTNAGPGGATTALPGPSMASRTLVGLRVVLVDNDESVLSGMDSMVRSWGCLPLPCQSVEELRAKLDTMAGEDVDCIIADYHLGIGTPNGLDAIELLRQRVAGHVAAAVFTGDLSIRPGNLRLPDVRVAHKPVVPGRTIALLEEMALETKRHRQQSPTGDSASPSFPWDENFP